MEQAQRYRRKSRSFPQFLAEEKFFFHRNVSALVSEDDISPIFDYQHRSNFLSYVNTGKYTFSFKAAKNIPIIGVDDKRQITAIVAVSYTGAFLPIQLIYAGKTERRLPKYSFTPFFSVTVT